MHRVSRPENTVTALQLITVILQFLVGSPMQLGVVFAQSIVSPDGMYQMRRLALLQNLQFEWPNDRHQKLHDTLFLVFLQ